MKLITKEIEKRVKQLGSQENSKDPIVVAKFFNPQGRGTWFVIDYDPETRIAFGYVSIFGDHCDELGDFAVWELEQYRGPLGIGIERDKTWQEKPLSEAKKELYKY